SSDLLQWTEVSSRMQRWLRVMTHPDGRISFFNDAAMGCSASPAELSAYREMLGVDADVTRRHATAAVVHLADSGYVRLQSNSAVVIADVARVGPDYLPGHGHADTLSFEMSLLGRRFLVNGGTSTYE